MATPQSGVTLRNGYVNIPAEVLDTYREALNATDELVTKVINTILDFFEDGTYSEDDLRLLYRELVALYGEVVAHASVDFFEEVRDISNPSERYTPQVYEELYDPQGYQARYLDDDIEEAKTKPSMRDFLPSRAHMRVRNIASQTIYKNAAADPAHPRWQRITHPGACGWCRLLASRGPVYVSRKTASLANLHDHCKCIMATAYTTATRYAGYSWKPFEEQYQAALDTVGDTRSINDLAAQMDKDAGRSHKAKNS